MDIEKTTERNPAKIKVPKNGPYLVTGGIPLSEETIGADEEGSSAEWRQTKVYPLQESYALCRCGKSKTPPYCDGSHIKAKFNGKETAGHEPFSKLASRIDGPDLCLLD